MDKALYGSFIVPLRKCPKNAWIGNKGASLVFLRRHKFRIPETFFVTGRAYEEFLQKGDQVFGKLKDELSRIPDFTYAVRSSTNIEDTQNFSHAGQFKTITGVRGREELIAAISEVWQSAAHPESEDYQAAIPGAKERVKCAVIIQRMIPAKLAGVCFSKNPVSQQDEVVTEAVEGAGDSLVQQGKNPFRWRIRNGNIKEGNPEHQYIGIVKYLAEATAKLKRLSRQHIDVEWVFDGVDVYFLQLRGITGNSRQHVYSNKMAQEMLPGLIKPLVWSVNIPLVNGTWIHILSRIIGKMGVRPGDLAKSFYYRTYFNVTNLAAIFKEFGVPLTVFEEMMLSEKKTKHTFNPGLRTIRHTFRIMAFVWSLLNFETFFKKEYPVLKDYCQKLDEEIAGSDVGEAFSVLFDKLFKAGQRLTFLNILIPVLMRIYDKRFTRQLKRRKLDYNKISFHADFPELEELSPLAYMQQCKKELEEFSERKGLQVTSLAQLREQEDAAIICREFDQFIHRFGHFSESGNDFSHPKWEEDEAFVFQMISSSAPVNKHKELVAFRELKPPGIKGMILKRSYFKAGRFKVYREQISSLYIFGYGLFRKLFLMLGRSFVEKSLIDENSDIFYLELKEVEKLVNSSGEVEKDRFRRQIMKRKREMEECRDVVLPSVIYGETPPVLTKANIRNFSGVPASPGTFQGKTRIVKRVADFNKVHRGDVLVIPFSDVSWTPVLVKAGGIVSESGGVLSHCSIIARELGIPALVSVENACTLQDDMKVTVNGSNGILTVHDDE